MLEKVANSKTPQLQCIHEYCTPNTECHGKKAMRFRPTANFTATTDAGICDTNLINIILL
jgi:hypothetical protein